MLTRRFLICMLTGLFAASAVRAQSVNLTEGPLAQQCVRNELTMQLEGTIKVKQDGKEMAYPHKAQARHVFLERYLEVGDFLVNKAVRHYSSAESTITFNNDESSKRTLREQRRFLVAQRVKDHPVVFSPEGVLTRDEMETLEHFDTLAISGLLPDKMIDVGKSWSIRNPVAQALCGFDGLTSHNLEGKLESVKDGLAHIKIVGNTTGINLGAQVVMLINARLEFDIKSQRITFLEWKESDQRTQGPITPALAAEVSIKLTRSAIEEPAEINRGALLKIPAAAAPPVELTNLQHTDLKGRFTLKHSREWHVVSPEGNAQLVMRHLERGDFIAQATITPWKKTELQKIMSIGDFADLMAKTPGWIEGKETDRKEFKAAELAKGQHAVYRVIASGELDGVATVQYFYLIVGAQGEQCIVTFSVVPQQVIRLGNRDVDLVRELTFP